MQQNIGGIVILLFMLPGLFVVGGDIPARAAVFTVNTMFDQNDLSPGNGLCVASVTVQPPFVFPLCTLRAAIEEANSLPGVDTVILPEGVYLLDLDGAGEDDAAAGDLDITDSLILTGAGREDTVIDGMNLDRVLDITKNNIRVTVSGMTITNGLVPAYLPTGQRRGGGIRNAGTLLVKNSSLTGNTVEYRDADDTGGGLFNSGTCIIDNSTLRRNTAGQGGGAANAAGAVMKIFASTIDHNTSGSGGGILNFGSVTAVNVTLSGNTADAGLDQSGGALRNWNDLSLIHATIAFNTAAGGGGGISSNGSLFMVNTIVAGNDGGDCLLARSIDSGGHNMAGDGSCGLNADLGDREKANPLLESLEDNGGATWTHALRQNSPAIDRGALLADVRADQRGVARPQRENADIGAYELEPFAVVPFFSPLLLK